jgi:acyl-CoA synthetase (NDP forming)
VAGEGGDLTKFFRPRNVALVGASDKSEWSKLIFSRFERFGHQGNLYAVNRTGASAHGLPGFTRCADIPEPVDMAYIYVPAGAVAGALAEAGAAGIRNAVVLTSGFSEAGEEGEALQKEVEAAARAAGVRMLGPNSLGFANIAHHCALTSINTRLPLRIGRLAIVSQSGAVANELGKFAHTQGIGLSFICATGNEADLTIADVVSYLVDDEETGAIAIYVESINDPALFAAAAARALAARKPIVLLKLGRSPVSAAIAKAHTGSLVGDDGVFDAMCRRYGVLRVASIEELVLTASFLERVGPIDPPRIGMMSLSGGACGMYADLAEIHGLDVPQFAPATQAALRAALPPFAATINPLDITGVVVSDPAIWSRVIPVVSADPGVGLAVTSLVLPNTDVEAASLKVGVKAAADGYAATGRPPVMMSLSLQEMSDLQREMLAELGIKNTLPNLDEGVRVLAHLQRWSERMLQGPPLERSVAPVAARPKGERETLAHLAASGAPVIPTTLAATADEAAQAAQALGGPAVLKIASPDIAHKTEAGGVRLNVSGADEARRVFDEIMASARAYAPSARLEGVIVAPMRKGGTELIVGVARDPSWGPAIAVGLGGVLAEALGDSVVRLLPIDAREAREMLLSLKASVLLKGFRGAPPADLDVLAAAIVAIGDAALALGPDLGALEVNPLRVLGTEIEALDGLTVYQDE